MSGDLAAQLVEHGVLDAPALERAAEHQRAHGVSFGKALMDLGLATEQQLVAAVAAAIGMRYTDVGPGSVDPQAAALLTRSDAERLVALPVGYEDGGQALVVAVADPQNTEAVQHLTAITGLRVIPALAARADLLQAVAALADATEAVDTKVLAGIAARDAGAGTESVEHEAPADPVPAGNGSAPAAATAQPAVMELLEFEEAMQLDLDAALNRLVDAGGSDLHLTAGLPPVMRVDGDLMPLEGFPVLKPNELRKALYSILTQKQREVFENELELDLSYAIPNRGRFRVNVFQQRGSIGSVMRLIPFEIKPLADLGVPTQVANFAYLTRGFVLVTGPTGSGKSTTLASVIDLVNTERSSHIMTVEDPIEFLHRHKRSVVNQRELGDDTHSFANALKHVLRQDPDVILVGEMRDLETIQVALTAAETGHLVFGTLHTQDAPQTVDRVIDVFPPHQQEQIRVQLSGALQGVVCQQLLKKADGAGRVVACEVMIATPAIRNLIREGKTHQMYSSIQAGKSHGMVAMDQSLATLVLQGKVTYDHALERCNNVGDFNRLCGRA